MSYNEWINKIDKLISSPFIIIKKYPDILILFGIFILFYKILMPASPESPFYTFQLGLGSKKTYNQEFKLLGIMLITIGIDIAIRRYLSFKKKNERKN